MNISQMIFIIYAIWFILLYMTPIFIFYKKIKITKNMIELRELELTPVFDGTNQTIIKINSDFDGFMKTALDTKSIKIENYVIRILRRLCNDAKLGNKINPNVYISNYKEICDKFVAYIFIAAHTPLIAAWSWLYWSRNFVSFLMPLLCMIYVICFILILILKRIADRNISLFTDIFYTYWYDSIANFDLITIKELKPAVLQALTSEDSNRLLAAIRTFSESDKQRCDMLTQSTNNLTEKLTELITLQNEHDEITWQNVIDSFDDNLKKVKDMNNNLTTIYTHINNTLQNVMVFSDKNKVNISAINNNAKLLLELKEYLSAYKSEALSTEVNHLERITASLENNINKTFISIDTTIKKNTDDLLLIYDNFFEICNQFNKSVSDNFEAGTIAALHALNDKFTEGFEKIDHINTDLEKTIKETSYSTHKLCDSVYDFTQFTLSPNFMNKIRTYHNFTKRLNDAHAKLVSYDQLVKIYEQSNDISVQEMGEQVQRPQIEAEYVKQMPEQIMQELIAKQLDEKIGSIPGEISSIKVKIENFQGETEKKLQEVSQKYIPKLYTQINEKIGKIENDQTIQKIDEKIGSIIREISSLKESIEPRQEETEKKLQELIKLNNKLQEKDTVTRKGENKPPLNKENDRDNKIISDFNVWSNNPVSKLPSDFYYVSGNMQVRTEQHIIESPTETRWITNREGMKYLFPNPNSFDQMTDISKLYKMDNEKLKAKGQNRIKVTKPCEISDKGYINYPGKLELM